MLALGEGVAPVQVGYAGPRWHQVLVDTDAGRIKVPVGAELDLGATAKAWAADRAAMRAATRLNSPVLVNLGGDIAVTGCDGERPFTVVLAEDHRDTAGPVVRVGDGGIATSSTLVRRWRTAGELRHHLLDPQLGTPAAGPWRTVTVAAASCLHANIASTACLVKGELGLRWLRHTRLPARLVGQRGELCTVNDWPVDEELPCRP